MQRKALQVRAPVVHGRAAERSRARRTPPTQERVQWPRPGARNEFAHRVPDPNEASPEVFAQYNPRIARTWSESDCPAISECRRMEIPWPPQSSNSRQTLPRGNASGLPEITG